MTGLEMVKLFQKHGWCLDRIKGSHYILKKNGKVEVIPVHSGKELSKGLEHQLKKDLNQ